MKIVRIEQDKIKVILSDSELLDFNIDVADLTLNSPELNLFLYEVMEIVNEETGFNAEQSQIVVEATSTEEGMILVLSKIQKKVNKNKIRGVRAVKKNESVIFEFSTFENLLNLLMYIDHSYLKNMKLYEYNKKFYIISPKKNMPLLMYEYAFRKGRSSIYESVLEEYGKLIMQKNELVNMSLSLKKNN